MSENDQLNNQYPTYISSHAEQEADEEADEFIRKYGVIKYTFIEPPAQNPWFTKPYALNYFHDGTLYRTKHERTSGKLELFLDLVYVGIVSNLALSAVKEHSVGSIIKYILLFLPVYNIWNDVKEMMNYYFNDDLIQRAFVIIEVILLVIYNNNCEFITDPYGIVLGYDSLLTSVLCYVFGRLLFAGLLVFYSLYIKEHRLQMRLFSASLLSTSILWLFTLLISSEKLLCFYAATLLILEQLFFCVSVHPTFKKYLGLKYSTALNIEHEEERFNAFYTIAIGEFLYGLCAESPLKYGMNNKLWKGISLLIISFIFLGFYAQKDGVLKATHALRRSATTAMVYIYSHLVLIGTMLIIGDAGVDLVKMGEYLEEEESGVLMFFHCGILVALISLLGIAYSDEDLQPSKSINRYWRTILRVPIGLLICAQTYRYKDTPIISILWADCFLLLLTFAYEFTVINWPTAVPH